MTLIVKGDLSKCDSTVGSAMADSEFVTLKKVSTAIEKFITTSESKLKGDSWDKVRAKLNIYITVIGLRQLIVEQFGPSSSSATSYLSNYMEEYSELDDSKLAEQENKLAALKSKINGLESALEGAKAAEEEELVKNIKNLINGNRIAIKELEPYIEKLRGLAAADAAASSKLSDASGEVSNFGKGLGVIGPGTGI